MDALFLFFADACRYAWINHMGQDKSVARSAQGTKL